MADVLPRDVPVAMAGLPPTHCWDAVPEPRGVVHVLHGMADHAGRYARLAMALNEAQFVVWAHDHRGHGRNPTFPVGHGHFADANGWRLVVDDAWRVSARIRETYPTLPLILFGHSMGSFVAQTLMAERGAAYDGVVLSGTNGPPRGLETFVAAIAVVQRLVLGPRRPGRWLDALVLGHYNRRFAPNRTSVDWLSRDEREVDKYVADDLCGFPLTAQSWLELLEGRKTLGTESHLQKIPKGLPVHLIAGAWDPVGEKGSGVQRLAAHYRRAGLTAVSMTLYEGARHEVINETNRDEVTRDLIAWLATIVPA